jgi:hypothetical protein
MRRSKARSEHGLRLAATPLACPSLEQARQNPVKPAFARQLNTRVEESTPKRVGSTSTHQEASNTKGLDVSEPSGVANASHGT